MPGPYYWGYLASLAIYRNVSEYLLFEYFYKVKGSIKIKKKSEMLDSPGNKAPAIFVSFLLTEITTVMILGSFPDHGRTL